MKKRIAIFTVCILLLTMVGCQAEREDLRVPEKESYVVAYVSEELTEPEARSLSVQILQIDGIWEATFVTAEEALEEFKAHQEDPDAFADVDASYLRHRYEITVESGKLDGVVKELKKIEGIAEVRTPKEILGPLA